MVKPEPYNGATTLTQDVDGAEYIIVKEEPAGTMIGYTAASTGEYVVVHRFGQAKELFDSTSAERG
jgi:hypothetical protein